MVGLTQSTCECLGELTEVSNESTSGYYLTDAEGGYPLLDSLTASLDCHGPNHVVQRLDRARSAAVRDFPLDVSVALRSRYRQRGGFTGHIGQPKRKAVLSPAGEVAGLELSLPVVRGQNLHLTGIALGLTASGPVTVNLWCSDPTVERDPVTVQAEPGRYPVAEVDWMLPQWTPASRGRVLYRVYYTVAGLPGQPYGNDLACCGVRPDHYGHFAVKGFSDTLNRTVDSQDAIGGSSRAFGMHLIGYTACDLTGWLATTRELGHYDLPDLIARAIRYKGAIHLMHDVLGSDDLSACTLLSREATYGRRNAYQKQYADIVAWIADNVPAGAVDCLGCATNPLLSTSLHPL
jgi:hypothetical protein